MTRSKEKPPRATSAVQAAPAARGGGTYGQEDFTTAAQPSRLQTDQLDDTRLPDPAQDDPRAHAPRSAKP